MAIIANFNDTNPAAAAGRQNVEFALDATTGNVSASVPDSASLVAPVVIQPTASTDNALILKGSAGTGAVLVQSKSAAFGVATVAMALTFTADVGAGSLIVVYGCAGTSTGTASFSVTDNFGNTYTNREQDGGDPNNLDNAIFTALSSTAGALTVTFHFNSGATTGALAIHEFSGVANTLVASDLVVNSPSANPLVLTFDDPVTDVVLQFVGCSTDTSSDFTCTTGEVLAEAVNTAGVSIATFWASKPAGTYHPSFTLSSLAGGFGAYLVAWMQTASGQSADLLENQDFNGVELSGVNGMGQFVMALTTGVPTNTPNSGAMAFDPATNTLYAWNGTAWKSTVLT